LVLRFTARLGDVIDAHQRKKDQFRLSPPIAVIRQARRGIDITRDGSSWLGGLPHLGGTPWPRSATGAPLQHLAQIALKDLPDHALLGWGDMGVIRFWISTDDLAAGRWDAVGVTRQSP